MTRRLAWGRNRRTSFILPMLFLLSMVACAAKASSMTPAAAPLPQASPGAPSSLTPTTSGCALPTVAAPTMPSEQPAFAALDPATGLHITGIPQNIDLASYRLEVSGKVDHPLQLSYDDLRCMPKVEGHPVLVCPGYFQDSANWGGVSIRYILALAGVQKDAITLRLTGADGYANSVQLSVTDSDASFLAYELEGKTLPVLHGFPLRAVLPGLYGNTWVKWLVKLQVN